MADLVLTLFDEFAVRRARGERPDVREYLERAGERADELRPLLDRLLASTPPMGEPDPAVLAAFEARMAGEPALLALRAHRGLSRDQVVKSLIDRLELDPLKLGKLKRYYHELETGLLDPRPVAARVFAALEEILRSADVQALAAWRAAPPAAPPAAFYRAREEIVVTEASPAEPSRDEEWDEVDELFRGARG